MLGPSSPVPDGLYFEAKRHRGRRRRFPEMHHALARPLSDSRDQRHARCSQEWTPIGGFARGTGSVGWRVEQRHRIADVAQPALRVFFEA